MDSWHHRDVRDDEFRTIIASSIDGFFLLDSTGHILEANDSYCSMVGYSREELLGKHISEIDPLDSVEDVARRSEEVIQKGALRFETKHRHKNGSIIDMEVSSNYSPSNGGTFFSFFRDITERKLSEAVVTRSTKLLQIIIDSLPVRIFWKDRELRYLGSNQAFAKDAGVECPEDLIGKDDYQLAWRDQAELYRNDDLKILESGVPKVSYDEPQTTPDGNQIWLRTSKVPLRNEADEVIGVLGIYDDITERKQVETDNKRLLLRQRAILDNLPMMAWLKDADSRLEMINQPYADACGHTIDECIGKTDLALFPEEMARVYIADDKKVCLSEQKISVEESISTPDGIKWHLTFKAPIYDEHGLVTGTAGIAQDITERKKAELALRESEEQFRSIVECTPNMVMIHVDNRFVYLNPTALEAFGISEQQEYIGKPIIEVVHPDFREVVRERVDRVSTLKKYNSKAEEQLLRKDGSSFWVEITGIPIQYLEKDAVLAIGVEITERKQSEERLRASERFLKTIIDSEPECIKMLDIDCNLLMMNPAGLEIIEADSFEQVKGQCVSPLVTEPYRDAFMNLTKQVFQGIPGTLEFEIIGLKGRHVWLDSHAVPYRNEQGEIVALLGITRDVTERKKSEKVIQEGKDILEDIIELSPISMAIVNLDGTIEQINRRAIETFGYFPSDIPNMERWWAQAYPDETYRSEVIAQWMGLVGKAIAEKREIERREYRVTCKDGTIKTTLIFGIPVSDKVFVMFDDITDRIRAENDRINLEHQLHQTQRLESLGVLAGGIAHDFNNLLAVIIGRCSLAKLRPLTAVDNIQPIEKAAERAAELCQQMMAYAGKSNFIESRVQLEELVDEMVRMSKASINLNVVVKQNLSKDIPSISADASQIRQVVMNLIINASEAIGEAPGEVLVLLTKTVIKAGQSEKDYLGTAIPPGRYACLEVIDNGCGMDKEIQQRIFEPFFTTKFTGRGLGMSAVLGIIKSHHGALQLFSQPGQGSTLKVYLPIQIGDFDEDQSTLTDTSSESWRGSGAILLVEDEKQIVEIAKAMLEALGFTVVVAFNGKEALDVYQKDAPDIKLVITDIGMPVMDGYALINELKKLKPDLPIIISTGFGRFEVSSRIGSENVAGLIIKPYNFMQLRELLKSVVGTPVVSFQVAR